jgi:16S rRNA (adenine1518-N6/adenine1519-N6)-dimethyltransferase
MRAKKSLGQNFLMHQATADRIADAARLHADDVVLEVGPGTGMLTRALLARAGNVVAVEADGELYARLAETFAAEIASGRLELVHGDIREFDLSKLGPYKVVANIPYYITGDLVRRFLESAVQPRSITLLVQKEVALRIAREPKESILSLSVKAYGMPKYEFTVPRGAFVPAPKVDSAVLSICDISRSLFATPAEEARFFALIRAGFAHKRKYLSSNLKEAGFAVSVPEKARAEDLGLREWVDLARASA